MPRPLICLVFAALATAFECMAVFAGGVAMVIQKGEEGAKEAKNGFLQAAYGSQLPGLNPNPIEVDGTDADAAALLALKEQAPDLVFAVGPRAARQARQILPNAFIVYAMVYFPETEGFFQDGKMVGVSSLGSVKELGNALKALMGKPRSVVLLHDASVSASIPDLLGRLKSETGIEARGASVNSGAGLKGAVEGLKGQASAVIFLPDPAALDSEAFKSAVAQCVAAGIYPMALSDGLVANGALCGSAYLPEEVGAQAARLAKEILEGKLPTAKLVPPPKASTSCNKATATSLRVKFPKEFRPETTYE